MRRTLVLHLVALVCTCAWPHPATAQPLEDLLNVEVTTVSRTPETRAVTPAAVFVITQEDIRRSGATSLPEALRLAPGVHVARIDANKWAVGTRGFTDRLAKAMLVMIDGRAVYSPLFAGTYWEVQDYLLEDVDRIEVVRGPGGTLWGANAVTGIINIITKSAQATHGTLVTAGGGTEDQGLAGFRYGGGDDRFSYRAYGKGSKRGPGFHGDGSEFDDREMVQAGFRTDWNLSRDGSLSLHGDLYTVHAGYRSVLTSFTPPYSQRVEDTGDFSGGNVVARWSGPFGTASGFRVQAFFDRTDRKEPTFHEVRDTLDVDAQASTKWSRHMLAWGAGFRNSSSDTQSVPTLQFLPNDFTDRLFSGFVEDQIDVQPSRLRLTFGAKLERNAYSGFEVQPSGRVFWTPTSAHTLAASVARAVRTPSRSERDLQISTLLDAAPPLFLRLVPNDAFQPERLTSYELIYRVRPHGGLYLSVAGFFNHHRDVLSTETAPVFRESTPPPPRLVLPVQFANGLHGNSHGVEADADIRLSDWWRWTAAYSLLRVQLTRDPDSRDVSQERFGEGSSPQHQVRVQSSVDLPGNLELDWLFRYLSDLPAQRVPAYATSDVRLGWLVTPRVELAILGKDLQQAHHLEFAGGSVGNVEVQRSVFGKVTWFW